LQEVVRQIPPDSAEYRVLSEFVAHIEGNLMSKAEIKIKERVRAIWKEHGKAAWLLLGP
jgi:hypothetical protein